MADDLRIPAHWRGFLSAILSAIITAIAVYITVMRVRELFWEMDQALFEDPSAAMAIGYGASLFTVAPAEGAALATTTYWLTSILHAHSGPRTRRYFGWLCGVGVVVAGAVAGSIAASQPVVRFMILAVAGLLQFVTLVGITHGVAHFLKWSRRRIFGITEIP